MKFLGMLFLFLLPLTSNASLMEKFESNCKYINEDKKVIYSGSCEIQPEIFKYSDDGAVTVYTAKFGKSEARILVYYNRVASLNDLPAIAKKKGRQLIITTGEGEVFIIEDPK